MNGVLASDNIDGDITSDITTTGSVDVNTAGTYTINYSAKDSSGNEATEVTRIVKVADNILVAGEKSTNVFGYSTLQRSDIATITFADTNTVPEGATELGDVGTTKNETVIAWYTPNADNSSLYDLTIGGYGKVKGNDNCNYLFYGYTNLTSIDFANFDTSNVTNMSQMFNGASGLTDLDLSSFNTSNVTSMQYMFVNTSNLTRLDLSNFDTSNVTNMLGMFQNATGLTSLDLSSFDTSNVTTMVQMFSGTSKLTSLDLSNFNTSQVTTMQSMFQAASSLTSLDLSSFDTSNVTTMTQMFYQTGSLTNIDFRNAVFTSVTGSSSMFNGIKAGATVTVKDAAAQSFLQSLYTSGVYVIAP